MDYTKGEWKVERVDEPQGRYAQGQFYITSTQIVKGEVKALAEVGFWNEKEAKANACLIATAPDMYEVLKKFQEVVTTFNTMLADHDTDNTKIVGVLDGMLDEIDLDKVIAKAEGNK